MSTITPRRLLQVLTPAQFRHWLRTAEAGERLLYHLGHLAVDREENITAHEVGLAAMQAAEGGFCHLFQQRHADGRMGYYASRTDEIDG